MNIAGIFLIDCRLLSHQDDLTYINQLLLKFSYKFPEAYWTFVLLDESNDYLLHFEKSIHPPRLNLTTPSKKVSIFDNIVNAIEKAERLMPIYDIQKVYVTIASLSKDTASKQFNVLQARHFIQTRKEKGWHFYFPFSSFESISSDIAFYE